MSGVNKRKQNGKVKKPAEFKPIVMSDSYGEWLCSDDGLKLFIRHWKPQNRETQACLHIVHGMGEHSLRYERIAQRLCKEGIEVWVADQRGHGKTADPLINNLGLGGLLGHCADKDAIGKVTSDIHLINNSIRNTYPNLPLFLLGHSWGSYISQNYIESYADYPLAGCILSGTRGPGDFFKLKAGKSVLKVLAALKDARKGSILARNLVDGPLNKPFKPNRTDFDWLSRDNAEVDLYVADPQCGAVCSVGFYRDLIILLSSIHKPSAMDKIRRDLPVYVFGGSADPAGNMGVSPTALVNAYRSLGIADLEFVLYPDARHEALNETNRDEVSENLISWIKRHYNRCDKDSNKKDKQDKEEVLMEKDKSKKNEDLSENGYNINSGEDVELSD